MQKYSLVLFDLDGTLFDTSCGIIKSVEATVEALGDTIIAKEIGVKSFIGPPIEYIFHNILQYDEDKTIKAAKIFREIYPSKFLYEAKEYDGISELLLMLKGSGVKVGVATNKRERYTLKLLDHFGLLNKIDIIHGTDEKGKYTKTDTINLCIKNMSANKRGAVMIGDSHQDALGAREAGVDFIAVTYGYGFKSAAEAERFCPEKICDSVQELIEYFGG